MNMAAGPVSDTASHIRRYIHKRTRACTDKQDARVMNESAACPQGPEPDDGNKYRFGTGAERKPAGGIAQSAMQRCGMSDVLAGSCGCPGSKTPMQVPATTSTIMRGFERKNALQRIRALIRARAIWCRVIMVSGSSRHLQRVLTMSTDFIRDSFVLFSLQITVESM